MEHARLVHSLSDDELLRHVVALTAKSRRADAEFVAHLAEVDARKLFARESCATMFGYCTTVLHLSESESFLRIRAARASRRFPAILGMLADGRLHLSGIAILVAHLTTDNAAAVLARAEHKSKRQVEVLIAALAPRPDVPPTIRRLPAAVAGTRHAGDVIDGAAGGTFPSAAVSANVGIGDGAGIGAELAVGAGVALSSGLALCPDTVKPVIQPLSPDRYKIQFTASASLKAKLERLQALVPGGDLAHALEVAVTEKLQRIEARRFGKIKSRRPVSPPPASPRAAAVSNEGDQGPMTESHRDSIRPLRREASVVGSVPATSAGTRYIAASVRREVCTRDGNRCRFVSRNGQRCVERNHLEFHHRHPYAHGGGNDAGNLSLMCRTHNAYLAEADYGKQAMAKFRQRSATGPVP